MFNLLLQSKKAKGELYNNRQKCLRFLSSFLFTIQNGYS